MARPLRIEFSGALYHVTARGDRREPIYEDDEDKEMFLNTLAQVVEGFNWICHSYCLMTNHYHLVVETTDGNLSKGMRQLNGVFTQAVPMICCVRRSTPTMRAGGWWVQQRSGSGLSL